MPCHTDGMRRMLLVAGLATVAVVSLAGCKSDAGSAASPSTLPASTVSSSVSPPATTSPGIPPTGKPTGRTGAPTPTGTPTPVPVPTGPTTPVPATQVQSAGIPANPPNGVATGNGGRTIVFTEEQSGCQHITATVTGETATSVAVLVVTTVTSKGGEMCPMIVRQVEVAVALSAPLGDRAIVFSGTTRHG